MTITLVHKILIYKVIVPISYHGTLLLKDQIDEIEYWVKQHLLRMTVEVIELEITTLLTSKIKI